MRIAEAMALGTAGTRTRKTAWVRAHHRGDTTLPFAVQVFRGADPVAVARPHRGDRDCLLDLASAAIAGYDADLVVVTTDAYIPNAAAHPLAPDGRDWREALGTRGYLQNLVEHHRGREDGWVLDAMTTVVANRAGDVAVGAQTYRVTGRRIEWLTEVNSGGEITEVGGVIPDTLREAMLATSLSPQLARAMAATGRTLADFGLDGDAARHHTDAAITRFITEMADLGEVTLYARRRSRRATIFADSVPRVPVVDPRTPGVV